VVWIFFHVPELRNFWAVETNFKGLNHARPSLPL
jgi:hypothetical protein